MRRFGSCAFPGSPLLLLFLRFLSLPLVSFTCASRSLRPSLHCPPASSTSCLRPSNLPHEAGLLLFARERSSLQSLDCCRSGSLDPATPARLSSGSVLAPQQPTHFAPVAPTPSVQPCQSPIFALSAFTTPRGWPSHLGDGSGPGHRTVAKVGAETRRKRPAHGRPERNEPVPAVSHLAIDDPQIQSCFVASRAELILRAPYRRETLVLARFGEPLQSKWVSVGALGIAIVVDRSELLALRAGPQAPLPSSSFTLSSRGALDSLSASLTTLPPASLFFFFVTFTLARSRCLIRSFGFLPLGFFIHPHREFF